MFGDFSKARISICAVLFTLAFAQVAPAQEPAPEQCLDPQLCPMPYVRLAKQETEPFLFLGRVVEEGGPQYGNYQRALRRFPDVRSCLTEAERGRGQPDLRQIDWKLMRDTYDIEVCVFRIATSVSSMDMLKRCLEQNRFHSTRLDSMHSASYTPPGVNSSFYMLTTFMTIREYRKIIPRSWIFGFLGIELNTGYYVITYYSKEQKVVGVDSSLTSRFDK
jgi:hypothetical protein